MVSVIIPVYNEELFISDCLSSLAKQTYKQMEIIVVDDGSTDNFELSTKNLEQKTKNHRIFKQKHLGPGVARNLGAKNAKGEVLVFVDADMTFDKQFIEKLISPIVSGKIRGTFTQEEFVSNWSNVWARCWNYNQNWPNGKRIPENYPDKSPVFRAILKSEFLKVGGFDNIGYTDDWTLSRKLGYRAEKASGAICYHKNPEDLKDVYDQARWIGKNEFLSGSFRRKIISFVRYNNLVQAFRGLYLSVKHKEPRFIVFNLVYYTAIYLSVLKSISGESKYK